MAQTLRIEIPIETVDNTEPELTNLIKKVGKLGEESDKAGEKAKKSQGYVTQFDRQAQKTEKSLASWAKEKYEVFLEAKERITPLLSTLKNGLRGFAGKTWNVTMRAVDFVTAPVRGILNLLKNPLFQAGAVLGVSIGLKDTIETYRDFEVAMSQVQAISGATGSEVEKLTKKAKEMGATTKFTAQESAEAFNYMAMAGWKTEDMLNGIEGILSLAAASGEDLGTTSDIVTDALTAFNMKAADAGHFSDVLATAASNANTTVSGMGETFKYAGSMAGSLGYSIEDVALMTGLMANAGIKGTMAGTALNSIFTRLATDAGASSKSLGALGTLTKELGIEFYDTEGNARDLSDVITELRAATAGMNDEEKTNIANTIAGLEAQKGLLAILNASEEDYNKLTDAINHADGAAAQMAETMMDNLGGSITLLQSAVDGVKISFGERLSPYIRNLADWLTAQMPAVEAGLNEFMDWLDGKVDRMQRKWQEITSTEAWQDADFFGKVRIAWDEWIAEPFSEWWNGAGKAKFAGFAQDIGKGIGTGLKAGVMTLLGIDLGETLDEGVSIGASFARGFSEGFDFEAISKKLWQGFGNLLSSAGKLLPGGEAADLSSVLSAAMLGKIVTPFLGLGKGAVSIGKGLFGLGKGVASIRKGLFGMDAAPVGSLVRSIVGTTGNQMFQGTGLLNMLANAGYTLTGGSATAGGYFGAGTAMAGGTAAAVGAAGITGGAAAGATLVSSALDAYKAIKSDNTEEKKAYGESAAWKAGGVAVGAAIGSVIPGVGNILGALVGGGIGGIVGWIKGNKVKEEYKKNVEEMQKEAEKAQKVFEATGYAMEEVRFKNEALAQAMEDSGVSASQFALMFQEECANVAKKAFGDISLSLAEVKKIAGEITFADMAKELNEFAQVTSDTEAALSSLKSAVSSLKKENWKVGLGMELSEIDKDSYKGVIEHFLSTSQAYIDDNHYEATVALRLLAGGEADTSGLDGYYNSLKEQMGVLGMELAGRVNIALEDSVITLNEAAELESLQAQISAITNRLAEAKTDAQMQALQIKHNGAALDIESFQALQEELQANVASASGQYEEALTLTLTNLNLQLADGVITQSDYDRAVAEATDGYYAQINELNARVSTFNLKSIATAWGTGLSKIMPDMEGTTTEKLTQALNRAILAHPDVGAWEEQDVVRWMGLDKLDFDSAEQNTIAAELIQTALAVPEGTKETLLQNYKDSLPTVDEIIKYLNWDQYSVGAFDSLTGVLLNSVEDSLASDEDWELYRGWSMNDPMIKGIRKEKMETGTQNIAADIRAALEASLDPDTVSEFMQSYMTNAIGNGVPSEFPLFRNNLERALTDSVADPFLIRPLVNVRPDFDISYTKFSSSAQAISGHAAGGYVSGGPQLSWLAEEGYGEFVIPTNPSRRSRALELYGQAGAALGVSAYADGGYAGGKIGNGMAYLSTDGNRNAPFAYHESTGDTYGEETLSVSPQKESGVAGIPIQVNVSMAPEIIVQASSGQKEEDIVSVIKRHMKEMAEELGGEIAERLEKVFSNMPLKEA